MHKTDNLNSNSNSNSKKQQNEIVNHMNGNLQDHAYMNMHTHPTSASGQLVNKDIRMENDRFSFADDKNNH